MKPYFVGLASIALLFATALSTIPLEDSETRTREVDTTAALQDSVRTLRSGEKLKLLPGTYVLDSPLLISLNDILIEGSGEETLLTLAPLANCPVIFVGKDEANPDTFVERVIIRNLRIDGARSLQTTEHWREPGPGGWFTNNGITFRQCRNCQADGVTVNSCASGGIVFALTCEDMTLKNIIAKDNAFDGIAWDGNVRRSKIIGSDCGENLFAGISLDLGVTECEFQNTHCLRNGSSGLFMRASRKNTFSSCHFSWNTDGAFTADGDVECMGAEDNTFSDCEFVSNRRNGFWQAGQNSRGNKLLRAAFEKNGAKDVDESFPAQAPLARL